MKNLWVVKRKSDGSLVSIWRAKSKAKRHYSDELDDLDIVKYVWNGGYFTDDLNDVFTGFLDAIEARRFSDMF